MGLVRLLQGRRILLDFDGPVCSVFAGYPAPLVAEDLRRELTAMGLTGVASVDTEDPMQVLRLAAHTTPGRSAEVDAALARLERQAVTSAAPTTGAHDLIGTCAASGHPVVIVSNNTAAAITDYLDAHGLRTAVAAVVGRDPHDVALMKPHPHLVYLSLDHLGVEASRAVLVGDSPTDITAAHTAGVAAIGYANKPGKTESLRRAEAVVTSMAAITDALTGPGR